MPRPKAKTKKPKLTTKELGTQDKVLERQRFLLRLIGRGIPPDQIKEMYAKQGYEVSERTIRDDRLAVRETLKAMYSDDAETTRTEIAAQYDDLGVQFQQIAQQALTNEGKKSYYAAVQALAQKKAVLDSKGKLAGVFIDKQEVTGSVTNYNINKEAPPTREDLQGVAEALAKLHPPTISTTPDVQENA